VTYTLKMEPGSSSETLLSIYRNTRCHRHPVYHSLDT